MLKMVRPAARNDEAAKSIHSLVFCPPMAAGNYALVRRTEEGASLLDMGRLPYATPSLNLAFIRQTGATLGANEVHLWAETAADDV